MRNRFVLLLCVSFLCAAAAAHAQTDRGYWRATSSTAMGITGDISISELKLSINFANFTIADIRPLNAQEVNAVFDNEQPPAGGTLYRVDIPGDKRFLHKNSLCGREPTQWMVTSVSGKALQVAFLSGAAMPVFKADVMANTTSLCGTYMYTR